MAIASFFSGFCIGGVLVWFYIWTRLRAEQRSLSEQNRRLESDLTTANSKLAEDRCEVLRLTEALATAKAELANADERRKEYAKEVEEMKSRLKTEFENIANRILEEKTVKFTAQNQTNLDQILTPLKTQIGEFKQKVELVYTNETADRRALLSQIENLAKLNIQVTEDAKNLTAALKGDSKVQGNWGELILQKVLERSGLTKDVEFTVQTNLKSETGANFRPDVIINLPDKRHFVVDSKVSLTAYERIYSADTQAEREFAMKQHAQSLRAHVQELADKRYQDLYQISAPDFVFMFIPIEPALGAALQRDARIFEDAFDKKVILVTPSTLLATLLTVTQIWKQERQTRNAFEIARRSGALYDKFEGLYQDLLDVGDKINKAASSHQAVIEKLKSGRGNLVKSIEDIRKLGAKAQKALPTNLVEEAAENDSGHDDAN